MDDAPPAPLWKKAVLLTAVIVPLVATAYAVVLLWNRLVTWNDIAILVGMYLLSGFGITIGYHRMLTHRGFESPWYVRGFFLAAGSMALQGPAIEWAATHLKHHAHADREGDPHSPLDGFWHAHLGWMFRDRFVRGTWARPFEADPVARFIDRTFLVWAALGFVVPYLLGGWTGLLWGGLVRVFLLHHVTWSVNSVCHTFGSRPNPTRDASRNAWLIGLLGMGEGWHNNHHAAPRSAYHGWRWWQFDGAGIVIRTLAALRLAQNVVTPPASPPAREAPPPVSAQDG